MWCKMEILCILGLMCSRLVVKYYAIKIHVTNYYRRGCHFLCKLFYNIDRYCFEYGNRRDVDLWRLFCIVCTPMNLSESVE